MDERDGSSVAQQLGFVVTGTLAILYLAAEKDLLFLPNAFDELSRTTFRGPIKLMEELLRLDSVRRATKLPNEGQT